MLEICPISLDEANKFVEDHHRHHKPVTGHKFSIGCTDGEKIVGVAIVGRPISRYLDDGWTLVKRKMNLKLRFRSLERRTGQRKVRKAGGNERKKSA